MSNAGFLSHEYQQATKLAEELQRAAEEASSSRLQRQTGILAAMAIRSLADMMDPLAAEHPNPTGPATTPLSVVRRLRPPTGEESVGGLRELASRLETVQLTDGDEARLEGLARLAGSEASVALRRIVRR